MSSVYNKNQKENGMTHDSYYNLQLRSSIVYNFININVYVYKSTVCCYDYKTRLDCTIIP